MTVTAQAGVNGRRLEAELNARGLMLPHYPASVEWATVGGYIAARGSGVLSTRYGKIEDLLLSLQRGDARRRADGHGRRPAPRGRARARAAVRRLGGHARRDHPRDAAARAAAGRAPVRGGRVPDGRRGHRARSAARCSAATGPSVVRMYDDVATRLAFAPVVGEDLRGVYTVFAFEGDPEAARLEERHTIALAQVAGAEVLDPGARAALVGPALRLLPPAPQPRAARRSGARSTSSRPTSGSARSTTRCTPRCACPTPTPGSSCACTSPTGTSGAR